MKNWFLKHEVKVESADRQERKSRYSMMNLKSERSNSNPFDVAKHLESNPFPEDPLYINFNYVNQVSLE